MEGTHGQTLVTGGAQEWPIHTRGRGDRNQWLTCGRRRGIWVDMVVDRGLKAGVRLVKL